MDIRVGAVRSKKKEEIPKTNDLKQIFPLWKSNLICHKMNGPKGMDGPFGERTWRMFLIG